MYTDATQPEDMDVPACPYHGDLRPGITSTSGTQRRSPSPTRAHRAARRPRSSLNDTAEETERLPTRASRPRASTDLSRRHRRSIDIDSSDVGHSSESSTRDLRSINRDTGEMYRPHFTSRDRDRPTQSCLRNDPEVSRISGVHVRIIETEKKYTVFNPKLPREKPKRTELSTERVGPEERFTDLAHEYWIDDLRRAKRQADLARWKAEDLHYNSRLSRLERFIENLLS